MRWTRWSPPRGPRERSWQRPGDGGVRVAEEGGGAGARDEAGDVEAVDWSCEVRRTTPRASRGTPARASRQTGHGPAWAVPLQLVADLGQVPRRLGQVVASVPGSCKDRVQRGELGGEPPRPRRADPVLDPGADDPHRLGPPGRRHPAHHAPPPDLPGRSHHRSHPELRDPLLVGPKAPTNTPLASPLASKRCSAEGCPLLLCDNRIAHRSAPARPGQSRCTGVVGASPGSLQGCLATSIARVSAGAGHEWLTR